MTERVIKRYSMAFKKQVVQEYEAGASIEGLRRKYGISGKQTVRNWINQYGRTGVRHRMTVIDEADVVVQNQVHLAAIPRSESTSWPIWKSWWRSCHWTS